MIPESTYTTSIYRVLPRLILKVTSGRPSGEPAGISISITDGGDLVELNETEAVLLAKSILNLVKGERP